MKAVPILLLILGAAAITSACDLFDYCHCANSNSTANDDATQSVCDFTKQDYGRGTITTVKSYKECYDAGIADNCLWADFCLIVGETGSYSNCRGNRGGSN
jgi:hypothetical protein